MDALKRLFGMGEPEMPDTRAPRRSRQVSDDEQAVERYRYLLRTAPPETIEQVHVEAFSQLTPDQRRLVLRELSDTLPPSEQAAGVAYDEDPRSLARLATRTEMRQPGTLERTWSSMPAMGPRAGLAGSPMMGNFMGAFAGVIIGSMVADAFFGDMGADAGAADTDAGADPGMDAADAGGDSGGFGDGFGDLGGDLGGFGDFGGGDF